MGAALPCTPPTAAVKGRESRGCKASEETDRCHSRESLLRSVWAREGADRRRCHGPGVKAYQGPAADYRNQ
eukprot:3869546-Pleurochrysis_carterae.AAC.1